MDNLLKNGDMVLLQNGDIKTIDGVDELIQRAMISLLMKKGNFPLDKSLGSELYTIDINKTDDFTLLSVINEALENIEEIKVTGLEKNIDYKNQRIDITLFLKIGDKQVDINLNNTMWG